MRETVVDSDEWPLWWRSPVSHDEASGRAITNLADVVQPQLLSALFRLSDRQQLKGEIPEQPIRHDYEFIELVVPRQRHAGVGKEHLNELGQLGLPAGRLKPITRNRLERMVLAE